MRRAVTDLGHGSACVGGAVGPGHVSGLWTVGLLTSRERGDGDAREDILHAAFVDPITGEVIDVRELPAQLS